MITALILRHSVPRCGSDMNRKTLIGGVVGAVLISHESVCAPALTFDLQAFSSQVAPDVDISRFNTRNVMSPGEHRVDILLNGQRQGRRTLEFMTLDAANDAQPCVDRALLVQLGVDLQSLLINPPLEEVRCRHLEQWLPLASSTVDASTLEWSVSIPHASLNASVRGYVDPVYWDDGIDAGLLNYTYSASTRTSGNGEDRRYLGLSGGLNLGSWRLRHQGALAWNSRTGLQRYQANATYLQRSIAPRQAQLTLGDSFSGGQTLESVRLRGVSLATDERMRAQSRQGYAPEVRGIADSNATVTIRQNGYILYETVVAPGPFVITDLYASGYGGDLLVSVTEVGGRRTTFIVPWSAAPQLLRVDTHTYQLNVGEVLQYGRTGNKPWVLQGALARGVSNYLTLYGGGSFTEGHHLGKLGFALGTPLGAFSVDGGQSSSRFPGQASLSGQSLGLGYTLNVPATGTHLALGMYRYSTRGYLGLQDALTLRERLRISHNTSDIARQKSRLDLAVSQQVGAGTLSLSGSSVGFWRRQDGRQTSFTLTYGATWRRVSWSLSAQRSRVEETRQLSNRERSDEVFYGGYGQRGRLDNRLMLTLSMPLGSSLNSPSLTSSFAREHGDQRGSQQQVGVNGLLGERAQAHYGFTAGRSRADHDTLETVNAYAGARTGAGQWRGGYAKAPGNAQLSFSSEGAVVAHAGGITFAQSLGESSALVHAPAAEGAMLGTGGGVRLDRKGYGVAPGLRAFQDNTVSLDPKGMPMDVELKESLQRVTPTLGAITLLRFETVSGRAVVIKATRKDGKPLPFAAQVFDEQGREVGVIGQASKAFVRGIAERGRLQVVWSSGASDRCYISYQLPARETANRQLSADLLEGHCLNPDGVTAR